jgi:formate/nitrite transporter FocA (FNT family)
MKNVSLFISSILAGICISLGGTAFLAIDNKVAGALFFTVGLFVICTFGFHLFTGKVCYTPFQENKAAYIGQLVMIWIGNFAGCFLYAKLLGATRSAAPLLEKVQGMCDAKTGDSLLSLFILGIFCNLLIFVAVDGFKENPHEIGKYLSLFFGVSVFIICGFEHCVADMFYFSLAYAWTGKMLIAELVITAGNIVGGLLIPLFRKYILIR